MGSGQGLLFWGNGWWLSLEDCIWCLDLDGFGDCLCVDCGSDVVILGRGGDTVYEEVVDGRQEL